MTEVVQPALGCWSPQLSQLQEEELEGAITAQTLPLSYSLQGLAFSECLGRTETPLMPKAVSVNYMVST